MTDPNDLLGVALLRVDLAMDALRTAREAIVGAADGLSVAQTARPASEGDGWPQDRAQFGAALRAARQACRLTRQQLATRAGVAEATVKNAETAQHGSAKTRALLVMALRSVQRVHRP
jgi:DNA-binding XRE family transcriptional regulator